MLVLSEAVLVIVIEKNELIIKERSSFPLTSRSAEALPQKEADDYEHEHENSSQVLKSTALQLNSEAVAHELMSLIKQQPEIADRHWLIHSKVNGLLFPGQYG